MKFPLAFGGLGIAETIGPKLDKVSEYTTCQKDSVGEGVAQKQHEKFVVIEGHAVVHPGAVVVHLEDAGTTYRTVMRTVRFDGLTLVTVSGIKKNIRILTLIFVIFKVSIIVHFSRILLLFEIKSRICF